MSCNHFFLCPEPSGRAFLHQRPPSGSGGSKVTRRLLPRRRGSRVGLRKWGGPGDAPAPAAAELLTAPESRGDSSAGPTHVRGARAPSAAQTGHGQVRAGSGSPGCAVDTRSLPAGSCGWAPALNRSGELGTREGTQKSYNPGVAGSGFRCGVLGAHGERTLAPDFFAFYRHTESPQGAVQLVTPPPGLSAEVSPSLGWDPMRPLRGDPEITLWAPMQTFA